MVEGSSGVSPSLVHSMYVGANYTHDRRIQYESLHPAGRIIIIFIIWNAMKE